MHVYKAKTQGKLRCHLEYFLVKINIFIKIHIPEIFCFRYPFKLRTAVRFSGFLIKFQRSSALPSLFDLDVQSIYGSNCYLPYRNSRDRADHVRITGFLNKAFLPFLLIALILSASLSIRSGICEENLWRNLIGTDPYSEIPVSLVRMI